MLLDHHDGPEFEWMHVHRSFDDHQAAFGKICVRIGRNSIEGIGQLKAAVWLASKASSNANTLPQLDMVQVTGR